MIHRLYELALAVYKVLQKWTAKRHYAKRTKAELLKLLKTRLNSTAKLVERFPRNTTNPIAQDIAPLAAPDGANDLSTQPRIDKSMGGNKRVRRTLHRPFSISNTMPRLLESELLSILSIRRSNQNIQIDHPVYGEIQTLVKLTCRQNVQHFWSKLPPDFRPLSGP